MEEIKNILMKNQFSSVEHNVDGDHLLKISREARYDMVKLNTGNMLSCARLSPPGQGGGGGAGAGDGRLPAGPALHAHTHTLGGGGGGGAGTRGTEEQKREHWTRCNVGLLGQYSKLTGY